MTQIPGTGGARVARARQALLPPGVRGLLCCVVLCGLCVRQKVRVGGAGLNDVCCPVPLFYFHYIVYWFTSTYPRILQPLRPRALLRRQGRAGRGDRLYQRHTAGLASGQRTWVNGVGWVVWSMASTSFVPSISPFVGHSLFLICQSVNQSINQSINQSTYYTASRWATPRRWSSTPPRRRTSS